MGESFAASNELSEPSDAESSAPIELSEDGREEEEEERAEAGNADSLGAGAPALPKEGLTPEDADKESLMALPSEEEEEEMEMEGLGLPLGELEEAGIAAMEDMEDGITEEEAAEGGTSSVPYAYCLWILEARM